MIEKPVLIKITSEMHVWVREDQVKSILDDPKKWGLGQDRMEDRNMTVSVVTAHPVMGQFDEKDYKQGDATVASIIISNKDKITSVNVDRTSREQQILTKAVSIS